MKFPAIETHSNYRAYFEEFIRLNQSSRSTFSQRGFARKIRWPASYLGDVLNDRRALTLNRALEFAEFGRFDVFQTERLTYMVLAEEKNPKVAAHFSNMLALRFDPSRTTGEGSDEFHRLPSIETLAISHLLGLRGKVLSPAEIRDSLYTFTELTDERVRREIDGLAALGVVETSASGKKSIRRKKFRLDEQDAGFQWHQRYLENSIRAFSFGSKISPGCLHSDFIELPLTQFEALRTRLMELRNWLRGIELENEKSVRTGRDLGELQLFQIDLNAFRISKAPSGEAKPRTQKQ